MSDLIQQLVLLQTLVENWAGILVRLGPTEASRDEAMRVISERFSKAGDTDEIMLILDDLLDLVDGTPASAFVRDLVKRAWLPTGSVEKMRGMRRTADDGSRDDDWMRDGMGGAGKLLGRKIHARTHAISVKVFFATNRRSAPKPEDGFTGEPGDGNLQGVAEVTIPVSHDPGGFEKKPWWNPFTRADDERRYIVLHRIEPLGAVEFASRLEQETLGGGDLLVFLHGYNVDFEEAARKAAQIAWDLQLDGRVLLFSWPSLGRLTGYTSDEERVMISEVHLMSFLRSLGDGPWDRVHLMAHSMGNRVLVNGLARGTGPSAKIGQVVFAAGDVYTEVFRQEFPSIRGQGLLHTCYASRNDFALRLSNLLHKADRIGHIVQAPFVIDGLETIDASSTDTGLLQLNHAYFSDKTSMIRDIGKLLREGAPAARRGLPASPDRSYWYFPG